MSEIPESIGLKWLADKLGPTNWDRRFMPVQVASCNPEIDAWHIDRLLSHCGPVPRGQAHCGQDPFLRRQATVAQFPIHHIVLQ